MGDAADDLTGQGQESLWAHQRGECEGPCPYCEEEDTCEQCGGCVTPPGSDGLCEDCMAEWDGEWDDLGGEGGAA